MNKLENYVSGKWVTGDGEGQLLYNAVTGNPIAAATSKGLDFAVILNYARTKGNPALRKMSFQQRGLMLKALAFHLQKHLDKFYTISYQTGATKADSWVDIEGGIGNLFSNASLRRKFPDESFCIDGEAHIFGGSDALITLQASLDQWDQIGRPGADRVRIQLLPKDSAEPIEHPANTKVYGRPYNELRVWMET